MIGVGWGFTPPSLQARRDRTARVQRGSLANDWLREGGNADWVYGYDAWADPVGGRQAA